MGKFTLNVIILAAGEGTRLRPLTNDKPKGLVELFGKSILERQIDLFTSCGITDISIVTGFNAEMIQFPHVNYFHIVDAKGSDGEGVEIGKGDVNFELFSELINKKCRDIPFIPEVWQGHKDNGAGFFNALNFLEKYL